MGGKQDQPRRGKYRKYTREERQEILEDVAALGRSEAMGKHGVPAGTLGNWLQAKLGEKSSASAESSSPPSTAVEVSVPVEGTKADEVPSKPKSAASQRVAKRYTPSQRAEILDYADREGITEAKRKFGVSRFSIYEWRRKVKRAAQGKGDSPTSGPDPLDIEAQRDREILAEWKRHPGLGPSQIRNQLRRKSVKVSVHTVRRVMEDDGYRPPKVKRDPHDERFEAVRPNHLWHLDWVHRHINKAGTFNLILIDDYSRYVTGNGVDDAERADMVIETFEQAVQRHGRPEMVIHDKGSAFWSWRGISRFTAFLTELGIDQIVAEYKEWNGKLEVFNANLHKEFFDVTHCYDVADMRRRLGTHLHWYNHQRTSHALGGLLVPADRFYGRVDEVLARIEAGGGRDGLDALQLRHRELEIFKVVSRGGVPEVWLLGHKLLALDERK